MKCPGQDMKYWKASAIFDVICPKCGGTVEFYKDDTSRKCSNCGHRFVNPNMDFGCASYCQYAEQCLGALPEDFTGAKDNLLKDKVAVEMKKFFQTDFKRIRQATTTAKYAEIIGKAERGNLAIILCAAYLYDIGRAEAQAILKKVGAGLQMIDEICQLLDLQEHTITETSLHTKILNDALVLRHFQDDVKDGVLTPESEHDYKDRLFTTSAKEIRMTFAATT